MQAVVEKASSKTHKQDLQHLFCEYFAISNTTVNDNLAQQLFSIPYFKGFIIYVDNKAAGFAVCFESFSTYQCKKVLNIHDFLIGSQYRRQGLAPLLLEDIECFCKENDFCKITLEVKGSNLTAQKLYLQSGFKDANLKTKSLHWQKLLNRHL
jgi:ribosomal protein S18 acetylase RimI-like enzyme